MRKLLKGELWEPVGMVWALSDTPGEFQVSFTPVCSNLYLTSAKREKRGLRLANFLSTPRAQLSVDPTLRKHGLPNFLSTGPAHIFVHIP